MTLTDEDVALLQDAEPLASMVIRTGVLSNGAKVSVIPSVVPGCVTLSLLWRRADGLQSRAWRRVSEALRADRAALEACVTRMLDEGEKRELPEWT